jgi:hypothetical protein
MEAHLGPRDRWPTSWGSGTHAETDAADVLPAEQLSTEAADVAAIATYDAAHLHGER